MILAAALLEIVSILPPKEAVHTDETFTYTVRVRNAGPDAAEDVVFRAGANATGLFRSIEGPPEWECDAAGPRFSMAAACITPSMPPNAEAVFTVKLAAPQPTAIPYRVDASITAKGERTRMLHSNLGLVSSAVQTELSIAPTKIDEERAAFEVRNDGPDDAKDVTVVIASAALGSGDGWKCAPSAYGVVCTRTALAAGASSKLEARGESSAKMEARVRAEQVFENEWRDNIARP